MKVGLYNSCFENGALAEVSLAVLANTLALTDDAEIIRLQTSPAPEALVLASGCSLERVSFRVVNTPPQTITDPNQPDHRYQALRDWSYELTSPYDLFINFADRVPLFCAAHRGVLFIQSPHDFLPLFYQNVWRSHLQSYQLKLVNSYYTRFWTNVFWELDCSVVYPPIPFPRVRDMSSQTNMILSIGPFDTLDAKRQLEIISVFRNLGSRLPDWSMAIMGSVAPRIADRKIFHELTRAADDAGIRLIMNPTISEQQALFERASILWHVSATDHATEREPHKSEPFSLRVLQAMSNGCIPLVKNSGGFAEVIRHGETGFFWKDLAELADYTNIVANDTVRRSCLSKATRKRVQDFRAERYVKAFVRHLQTSFEIRGGNKANWWKRLLNRKHSSHIITPIET